MKIIKNLRRKKLLYPLFILFLIALFLRFLFFPDNTQFAYDHARDAIISQDILKGELKMIGPPSTGNPNLTHGVLFYYIAAPIYFLSGGNPEGLSLFLRIYNALGVFLIFLLGAALANKRIGIIAALLFAVSFEQTQYALFIGHPSMAILATLLFYLGFALLIFQRKAWGLIVSAIGYGLSLQFHIGLLFITPFFILFPIIFLKELPKIDKKTWLFSLLGFCLVSVTFIVAEIVYKLRAIKGLFSFLGEQGTATDFVTKLQSINTLIDRYVTDNFFPVPFLGAGLLVLALLFFWILKNKPTRKIGIFLLVWFVWGLVPYYLADSKTYYFSIGTSFSLLLLMAVVLNDALQKKKALGIALLSLIIIANLRSILLINPLGPTIAITSQDGMLLKQEKEIIDFTYQKANNQPFAVNAISIPFQINTTWSYLYDWYGRKTYGYVPIWGGSHADGYPTKLEVNNARSQLPEKRFLIIESTQGLQESVVRDFIEDENQFSTPISTSAAGLITVFEQKAKDN